MITTTDQLKYGFTANRNKKIYKLPLLNSKSQYANNQRYV